MLQQISKNILNKYLLFFIALLVGCLYVLPHVINYVYSSSQRTYVPLSYSELLYGAQVKEIFEGHLTIGDPQFFEHKYTFPVPFPFIPPLLLAALSFLTGSVSGGFFLSDFIFPAVLFLTAFWFLRLFIKTRIYAILGSLGLLVFYPLLTKVPPLSPQLMGSLGKAFFLIDTRLPLPFYRTPNPQITYVFLLIGLYFLYRTWRSPTRLSTLMTTLVGMSLLGIYFYHATFFVFIVFILFCIAIFQRKKNQIKHLLIIGCGLVLVTGVYMYISNLPQFLTLKVTGGVFSARYIDWIFTLRYAAILLLLWWLGRKMDVWNRIYLSALLTASICVMNFQLFTGCTIQPGHWPQTTLEPTLFLVIAIILFPYWERLIIQKLTRLFIGLVLVYALIYQVRFVMLSPNVWSISSDFSQVITWLNLNSTNETVVTGLDVNTLGYIPVLTQANIFLPVEQYHFATMDEIWNRIIFTYRLYGITKIPDLQNLVPVGVYFEQAYNVNRFKHFPLSEYSSDLRNQINSCYPSLCTTIYSLPTSVLAAINNRFDQLMQKPNPYRLTFALYTPYERSLGVSPPPGKLVFRSGEYYVYAVNDSFKSSSNEQLK